MLKAYIDTGGSEKVGKLNYLQVFKNESSGEQPDLCNSSLHRWSWRSIRTPTFTLPWSSSPSLNHYLTPFTTFLTTKWQVLPARATWSTILFGLCKVSRNYKIQNPTTLYSIFESSLILTDVWCLKAVGSDECNQGGSAQDEGDRPAARWDSSGKQEKYWVSLQVSRPTHRGGGETSF